MTHGCLRIISRYDGVRRKAFLHTYHTGMDIPKAVGMSLKVMAQYYAWVGEDRKTVETVRKFLYIINAGDRLHYVNSVAALIIAAIPCFLEPVTPGNLKDLPTWAGVDHPYTLYISETGSWRLTNQEGETILRLEEPIMKL